MLRLLFDVPKKIKSGRLASMKLMCLNVKIAKKVARFIFYHKLCLAFIISVSYFPMIPLPLLLFITIIVIFLHTFTRT